MWSVIQIKVAKISTWMKPLAYSPLYMAPTPGMNPRKAASSGAAGLVRFHTRRHGSRAGVAA